MRQLTASEASNDEMERQRFDNWVSENGKYPRAVERNHDGQYILLSTSDRWDTWQAALKSKHLEV